MTTINYWVVGADWEGDKQDADFYQQGSWRMGWEDCVKPKYVKLRDSIKANDRIAVKSMNGRGSETITIKAIGIVKAVKDGIVFVDWVLTKLDRKVPCKNFMGTIHGPMKDELWIAHAFRL